MNLDYMIREDGSAMITKVPQPCAVMEFPASIDGHAVAEIGTDIIPMGKKSIPREIRLPHTLIRIAPHAFNDLRYLKKLVIPQGLREISDFGIFTCPDLTELYIPSSVVDFGQYAFGYMYEHARAYKLNYFTLVCEEGSAAQKFAEENGIEYRNV